MRCPSCKNATLRAWKGDLTLSGVTVRTQGRRCASCSEIVFDYEEVGRQEHAVAAGLVERGVRTGPEFALVRKAAGLKASEVAELFDVRAETISRWERGEIAIPRMAAFALAQLFAHPKLTRRSFKALATAG